MSATTILVEASKLEAPGGWERSTLDTANVRKFLLAGVAARKAPAAGGIVIPNAGKWHLWVRSKDYPKDRPGVRNFTVRLGDKRSPTIFGKHGRPEYDGWAWEDGGTFDLPAGPVLLVIGDESTPSARCDAVLLTDNMGYQPEGPAWKLNKEAAKVAPLEITAESKRNFLPPALQSASDKPVAALENEVTRLEFCPASTESGEAVALRAFTRKDEKWVPLTDDLGSEGYRVLFRPPESDPKIQSALPYPLWDISWAPAITVACHGSSVQTRLGIQTAPWSSGKVSALRPKAAWQVDGNTVELTFPSIDAGELKATWRLASGRADAAVALDFTPNKPGHFSLGYHAPLAIAPDSADFLLLPFMFQGKRFPEEPVAILSSNTPTPLALVNRGGVSCALVAEPDQIAPEWPDDKNSRYAFGLRNETDQAQPFIYSPVLGQVGTRSDGAVVQARFRLILQTGSWYEAYRHVADDLFGLKDYRRPTMASLSDAALNLTDFIRDEKASGWDARAKGPWNIESRNTVSQSSPLTYLSLYLLTGDEDLYQRFARPSLEFMLSRPSQHFAAEHEIWDNYYHHQRMAGPASFYGAISFASAFAMTQGHSPVLGEFCLNEKGAPRPTPQHGHVQSFEDALALYRLTGDGHWREAAIAGGDKYIAENLTKLPTKDLGGRPFLNVSFVPDWEGLLHLSETTGEPRFREAAVESARWLLTTLWTQPMIPQKDITINPGGVYDTQRHLWWWGDRIYRRGVFEGSADMVGSYPDAPRVPEKRVPAWQVSQVGEGLEQPFTYSRKGPRANIMMNVWASNLLRLQETDPAFRTAARNATIGRFANYPGYYLDGPTDLVQRPDYPVAGPDVTSLYVHHAPPFLAYVLDYLFTDAEMRSKGAVSFPWVRSCGYVWFDSRLYGHAPGKVYGETAWPWLHRTAATADTVNVDRVLAEGGGKFHVVLLNQVHEPQTVKVTFDAGVLGRTLEGATVAVHLGNIASPPLPVMNGSVSLTLPPLGIAALTLDGVKIDVPTHRVAPPEKLAIPAGHSALQAVALGNTKLEARGTVLHVPPFTWRDLYFYATAGIDDGQAARLHYRVGAGAEQTLESTQFPWEFSVKLEDLKAPVEWWMELKMADGQWIASKPSSLPDTP